MPATAKKNRRNNDVKRASRRRKIDDCADAKARIETHEELCILQGQQVRADIGELKVTVKDVPLLKVQLDHLAERLSKQDKILAAILLGVGAETLHLIFGKLFGG